MYLPSSAEKKRAVVMYFLFGIIMMLPKVQMNVFEYFHLKQATGRWMTFVVFFIVFAVLLFLPVIKYLGLIPLIALIGMWAFFIKQARDGKYLVIKDNGKGGWLAVFSWIGWWLLTLFEISPQVDMLDVDDIVPPVIPDVSV